MTCALLTLAHTTPFDVAVAGESLTQALTSAYDQSPRLDAERARLRATDEGVSQARSGWRPNISADAGYGYSQSNTKPASSASGTTKPTSYGVTVQQPLFDGFQTRYRVRGAEARVRAARAQLRALEAEVLLAAVTSYMDVVRDQSLVNLNERNVRVLRGELTAANERRRLREVTLTDVAQARARLARGQSALDEARAALRTSQAEYRRVVGHAPKGVRMPPMRLKLVPRDVEAAVHFALREAPRVHLALYQEQAARHDVDRVSGELLPRVQLEARYEEDLDPTNEFSKRQAASVFGRVTVPLYSGGETRSRVRIAKHQHVGRLQEVEAARREVRSRVTAAWSQLRAGQARIRSDQVQVKASRTALDGVRAEQRVGQRSLLDVLNAEQELLEANAALYRTKRNKVVAQFRLLAEIGRLDAELLRLPTAIYDPKAHYEEAKGKWLTTSITQPDPPSQAEVAEGRARAAWKLRPQVEPTSEPQAPPLREGVTLLPEQPVVGPEDQRQIPVTDQPPPPIPLVRQASPPPATSDWETASSRTSRTPSGRIDELERVRATRGPAFPGDAPVAAAPIRTGSIRRSDERAARRPSLRHVPTRKFGSVRLRPRQTARAQAKPVDRAPAPVLRPSAAPTHQAEAAPAPVLKLRGGVGHLTNQHAPLRSSTR